MKFSLPAQRASQQRNAKARSISGQASSHRNVGCQLTIIPVRLDQTPGEVCWSSSCSLDMSGTNLAIMVDRDEPLPVRFLVVGAEINGAATTFAMMKIQSQQKMDGDLRIDAIAMKDPAKDLLSDRHLAPRIDANHFRFQYGCPQDILSQWESLGVMRKYLVDRILVCPDCSSIPTWRNACAKCGSARYRRTRLIHHFACAHVDHTETFQAAADGLRCPKCRAKGLIAGTDFQYIAGPLACFDCGDNGCQPTLCCMCHQCVQRFDPSAATEQELYGYHVDRLDLLDLVAASE